MLTLSGSPVFIAFLAASIAVFAVVRAILYRTNRLTRFFGFVGRVEIGAITLLLAALVFLGCMQIVLRNFFHSGIIWADPLMRNIVLWLGCLGAALATTQVRHINIDVFSRILPKRHKPVRRFLIYTATALAAFILGLAALRLVADERAFGDIAFGGIKTWVLQTVLPFAFFVISYRSLVNLFTARDARPADGEMESLEP